LSALPPWWIIHVAQGNTSPPQADHDWNGVIDAAAVALVEAHRGYVCPHRIVAGGSWRTLKAIDR
jgi:hypothetical protein